MFSNLWKAFFGNSGGSSPSYPSVILILEVTSYSYNVLHFVPEDGTMEQLGRYRPGATKFSANGSKERFREFLDDVLLYVAEGETQDQFFAEIAQRTVQNLTGSIKDGEGGADAIYRALASAAHDSIRDRQGRPPPQKAAQWYKVYIALINRPRPGRIMADYEPKSIRWD